MARVYFKTFGCSTNFSETEIMKGLLKKADFDMVNSEEEAYVIILNICTVKTDTLALREIRRISSRYPDKKLIVAGCIPRHLVKEIREISPDASLISTHNIKQIVMVVEETINDNPIEVLTQNYKVKINLPKIRRNSAIGIIPIANSCVDNCAYCSVRSIKGKFFSYPLESIVAEAKKCIDDGCKEIWLTAQDTGCYGQDIGTDIVKLLREILKTERDFMIRLGMANPHHIEGYVEELIKIYKDKRMFKFLHIPVQSGNNEILKKMNRKYTAEEFEEIARRFREEIPEITISTDIICGFPGETREQFTDSVRLIERVRPDVLNISRFRARPGTPAAKMEQVNGEETKNRSRHMTSAFDWIAFECNKKWRNWEGNIIIDEEGKENTWVGRNYCYKPVVVKGNLRLGEVVRVRVTDITKHDLRGELT